MEGSVEEMALVMSGGTCFDVVDRLWVVHIHSGSSMDVEYSPCCSIERWRTAVLAPEVDRREQ